VTVAIYSVGPVEALVLGNVKVPGKYTLPPPARLTDAIAAAGGLGPVDGDLPDARLEAPEGTTKSVRRCRSSCTTVTRAKTSSSRAARPCTYPRQAYLQRRKYWERSTSPAIAQYTRATTSRWPWLEPVRAPRKSPTSTAFSVSHHGADGKTSTQTVNLYPILKDGDLLARCYIAEGRPRFRASGGHQGVSYSICSTSLRFLMP
jgi:hypothetical protein